MENVQIKHIWGVGIQVGNEVVRFPQLGQLLEAIVQVEKDIYYAEIDARNEIDPPLSLEGEAA